MNGSGDCDEVVRAVTARLPSGVAVWAAVWAAAVTDDASAAGMTSAGAPTGLAVEAGKGGAGG
jgi:hypothetical protein